MLVRHRSSFASESATTLPLFKFLLIVGALLFAGLMALGAYYEPAPLAAKRVDGNARSNAAIIGK